MTEFQPGTFFQFARTEDLTTRSGFTYKLGLNYAIKKFIGSQEYYGGSIWYTTIDNLIEFEEGNEMIMIIKIPVGVPIIEIDKYYVSHCMFVESIHLYTDFLKDNTIVPELRANMVVPDLRMSIFHTDKEAYLKPVKNGNNVFWCIKN